ncbi:hypothetical protein FFLO_05562 [Filobasidium floriforme]|uniref:Uncharacterized protein n=2 Tax=Filobasidium floriforme TaxID=5210 RepID=A0A8K0JGN0_9TREE|nr:hypothetical protein FFLO_05562 [Filobasidium floriforme]
MNNPACAQNKNQPTSAYEEEVFWDLTGRCLGTHAAQMQPEDNCIQRILEALDESIKPEDDGTPISRSSSTWSVSLVEYEQDNHDSADKASQGSVLHGMNHVHQSFDEALEAHGNGNKDLDAYRSDGSDWVNIEGRSTSNVSMDCLVSSLSSPSVDSVIQPTELHEIESAIHASEWQGLGISHPQIAQVELGWPFNEEAFEHAVKMKMQGSKSAPGYSSSVADWSTAVRDETARDLIKNASVDNEPAEEDLERILSMLAIEDGFGSREVAPRAPTPPPVFRRATVPQIVIPPRPTFVSSKTDGWACRDARDLASPTVRPLAYFSTRTPGIGGHSGYFTSTLLKQASEGPIPPSLLKRQARSPIADAGNLPTSPLLYQGKTIIPFNIILSPTESAGSSRSEWETTDDSSEYSSPFMFSVSRPGTPRPMDKAKSMDFTACHDKAFNPYFMDADM